MEINKVILKFIQNNSPRISKLFPRGKKRRRKGGEGGEKEDNNSNSDN